jgi:hypothetical protein
MLYVLLDICVSLTKSVVQLQQRGEKSPATLKLALETMGSFSLQETYLTDLLREELCGYLDHDLA